MIFSTGGTPPEKPITCRKGSVDGLRPSHRTCTHGTLFYS
jgi:hypothetical protein